MKRLIDWWYELPVMASVMVFLALVAVGLLGIALIVSN